MIQTQTVYLAECMFLLTGKKVNTKRKGVSFSMCENTMIYFLYSVERHMLHCTSGYITLVSPGEFVEMGTNL